MGGCATVLFSSRIRAHMCVCMRVYVQVQVSVGVGKRRMEGFVGSAVCSCLCLPPLSSCLFVSLSFCVSLFSHLSLSPSKPFSPTVSCSLACVYTCVCMRIRVYVRMCAIVVTYYL